MTAWMPASAHADLEVVAKDLKTTGYTLLANDRSTEANRILITMNDARTTWTLSDAAGIASFPAECSRIESEIVQCQAAPFNIVGFQLGAGADAVKAKGRYRAQGPEERRYVDLAVGLGKGNDRFTGGGGLNAVFGGEGRDGLLGGARRDSMFGGAGRDVLKGIAGRDFLVGGRGNDRLYAGAGIPDLMIGGKGRDRCSGQRRDRVASCEKVVVSG
jgi:hypothetical protein